MSSETQREIVSIVKATLANSAYRQTVITGKLSQVVLMTIQPGEEIGAEVHEDHDQILVLVEGRGQAVLQGQAREVETNDLVFVHAGVEHNFINTGSRPLKLYTIYSPPEHPEGTRHETKAAAGDH